MNCGKWEQWAALAEEGELAEERTLLLEAHRAGCASCGKFALEVAASQAWLHDLRWEIPDASEYQRLRDGVMRRLSEERRASWRPYAVAAGLLLMVAGSYWVERGRFRQPTAPNRVVAAGAAWTPAPRIPTEIRTALAGHPQARRFPRKHAAAVLETENAAAPLVVKLATDDPDVTIIWLIDKKGEGR